MSLSLFWHRSFRSDDDSFCETPERNFYFITRLQFNLSKFNIIAFVQIHWICRCNFIQIIQTTTSSTNKTFVIISWVNCWLFIFILNLSFLFKLILKNVTYSERLSATGSSFDIHPDRAGSGIALTRLEMLSTLVATFVHLIHPAGPWMSFLK